MQAEFTLKAQNQEIGIFRYYHISIVPTLFQEWALIIANGRIGHKARQRSILFTDIQTLAKKFKEVLTKRLKAERRIGCSYKIIEQHYDQEFEEKVYTSLSTFLL